MSLLPPAESASTDLGHTNASASVASGTQTLSRGPSPRPGRSEKEDLEVLAEWMNAECGEPLFNDQLLQVSEPAVFHSFLEKVSGQSLSAYGRLSGGATAAHKMADMNLCFVFLFASGALKQATDPFGPQDLLEHNELVIRAVLWRVVSRFCLARLDSWTSEAPDDGGKNLTLAKAAQVLRPAPELAAATPPPPPPLESPASVGGGLKKSGSGVRIAQFSMEDEDPTLDQQQVLDCVMADGESTPAPLSLVGNSSAPPPPRSLNSAGWTQLQGEQRAGYITLNDVARHDNENMRGGVWGTRSTSAAPRGTSPMSGINLIGLGLCNNFFSCMQPQKD